MLLKEKDYFGAANLTNQYELDNYRDWYLPNINELYCLYKNRTKIGNFSDDLYYWSSTEINENESYCFDFKYGSKFSEFKSNLFRVRLVRKF